MTNPTRHDLEKLGLLSRASSWDLALDVEASEECTGQGLGLGPASCSSGARALPGAGCQVSLLLSTHAPTCLPDCLRHCHCTTTITPFNR